MRALKGFGVGKKSIEDKCLEEAVALCEELKKFDGKPFDPKELLMISVSNIICSVVYGERHHICNNIFFYTQIIIDW